MQVQALNQNSRLATPSLNAMQRNNAVSNTMATQPKFGDMIVSIDLDHADFKVRRDLITQALAAVKGAVLWTAKQFHNHGVFDALYIEGKDHDGIKAALAPLKKSGLVQDFFAN
jgi:hypothetical protein